MKMRHAFCPLQPHLDKCQPLFVIWCSTRNSASHSLSLKHVKFLVCIKMWAGGGGAVNRSYTVAVECVKLCTIFKV
jgi:hypothetical protein